MAYQHPVVVPVSDEKRQSLQERGYLPYFSLKHVFNDTTMQSFFFTEMDFSYDPETFSTLETIKEYERRYSEMKPHLSGHSLMNPKTHLELLEGNILSFNFDAAFRFLYDLFHEALEQKETRPMNFYDICYHYQTFIIGFSLEGQPLFDFNEPQYTTDDKKFKSLYMLCMPESGQEGNIYTIKLNNKLIDLFREPTADYSNSHFLGEHPIEAYRFMDMEATEKTLNKQFLSLILQIKEGRLVYEYMLRSQTIHEVGQPNIYEYLTRSGKVNQSPNKKWENSRIQAHPFLRDDFRLQYSNNLVHYIPDNDYEDHPVMRFTGLKEYIDLYHQEARNANRADKEPILFPIYSDTGQPKVRLDISRLASNLMTSFFSNLYSDNRHLFVHKSLYELKPHLREKMEANIPTLFEIPPIILQYAKNKNNLSNLNYMFRRDMSDYFKTVESYLINSHLRVFFARRMAHFKSIPSILLSHTQDYRANNFLGVFRLGYHPYEHITSYMEYHHVNPAIEQVMKDPLLRGFGYSSVKGEHPLIEPHATTSHGAFKLSKNLLRIISQIDTVRLNYESIHKAQVAQRARQGAPLRVQQGRRGFGNQNHHYNSNALFSKLINRLDDLLLYERYFSHSEKPSQRFFTSVNEFYRSALDTGNHMVSLTQAIDSCVLPFTDEEENNHVLAMQLGSYVNYMRHAVQYQALSLAQFHSEFNDYLTMKVKIHKSTDFDYFPRPSLRLAHDVALRDFNLIKHALEREEFKKRVASYGKKLVFEPKKNPLVFIAPEEPEQVIEEGRNLRHCVGSYVSRISDGKTYIMFLRHKDHLDESMYTIEISQDYQLVQRQGRKGEFSEEIDDAIAQYNRHLRKKREELLRSDKVSYSVS